MPADVKPATQNPQDKPWYISLFEWAAGDTLKSVQHKVKAAGSDVLGQVLASDKVAQGVKTLSEKTLFVHPVTSVNTLHATIKKVANSKTLELTAFQGLQVQFAALIASEEGAKLDSEPFAVLSEMSTRLTTMRKELTGKSPAEQAQGLATLKEELPGMAKCVGSIVEEGSIIRRVATTFCTTLCNVIVSKAKVVAPFLFVERAPPSRIKIDENPPSPDLNVARETQVQAVQLASNVGACLTVRLFCATFCGIKSDMNDYRTILAQGKDRLKRSTLDFLKQKNVSCLRYFFVWCFFSIGYWLIHRYVERATQAYLREALSFIATGKNHKYERLINTTLEEGGAFFYAINAKLRRRSNLINEQFQKELELPDSEEIYDEIGRDLFKKARINWIVALLIKWFIASPKEIAKKATASLTESLHENQQAGLNKIFLDLLKQAEKFQREHPEPLPDKDHPLKRMELVGGYVRNFVDAAFMSSCKTPDQIANGVQNRSFPNDPIGQFLDGIPKEVMTEAQRTKIGVQSHEKLMRGAISGFADVIEKTVQEKSLQKGLYKMLVSANTLFLPVNPEEAQTPEQLDSTVREHMVHLMNGVIAKKLQLPDEATPHLPPITTPYANACLSLISNSLQPAFFQRVLAIYLKSS